MRYRRIPLGSAVEISQSLEDKRSSRHDSEYLKIVYQTEPPPLLHPRSIWDSICLYRKFPLLIPVLRLMSISARHAGAQVRS